MVDFKTTKKGDTYFLDGVEQPDCFGVFWEAAVHGPDGDQCRRCASKDACFESFCSDRLQGAVVRHGRTPEILSSMLEVGPSAIEAGLTRMKEDQKEVQEDQAGKDSANSGTDGLTPVEAAWRAKHKVEKELKESSEPREDSEETIDAVDEETAVSEESEDTTDVVDAEEVTDTEEMADQANPTEVVEEKAVDREESEDTIDVAKEAPAPRKVRRKKAPPKKKVAAKKAPPKKKGKKRPPQQAGSPVISAEEPATIKKPTIDVAKRATGLEGTREFGEHTWEGRWERERSRSKAVANLRPGQKLSVVRRLGSNEPRQFRATVRQGFYEYQDGTKYPTLYKMTEAITGAKSVWSGPRFWKLT